METSKIKTAILVILFICIGVFATCEFTKQVQTTADQFQPLDTLFLSQWRREKQEKLDLIASYEKELYRLQKDNDSMQVLVSETKKTISAYRVKTNVFQQQLKQAIVEVFSNDSLVEDTISPILDSLILSQQQSNSACDTTIHVLEIIVANRDSSLLFQKQIEANLRDLGKQQELRNQYLTLQLDIAFKSEKKKSRQNKLLKGGLLILTGITASLLISQQLK